MLTYYNALFPAGRCPRNRLDSEPATHIIGPSPARLRGLIGWVLLCAIGSLGLRSQVSLPAYELLNERVVANRRAFYVYKDADSGFNHGFASGFYGTTSRIAVDSACLDDPGSIGGCSSDPSRLDTNRGTVLRVTFAPIPVGQWAGVNIEEPENWGVRPTGRGYDLRGAKKVVFDVRTPTPDGVRVQFGVNGWTTQYYHIPQSDNYTTLELDLPPNILENAHILFAVAAADWSLPAGGTVLLDNIRFEPPPTNRSNVIGFPTANQVWGVVSCTNVQPGRVPIPLDQMLRNLTTTYESALTMEVLWYRGYPGDIENVRWLAEAFHYALHHDNSGLPLPIGTDGARGLHNGYEDGDLPLFNDQGTGAGRQGEVRLAGFSAGPMCGPSGYCLVLDGATGGNNAFAILGLLCAWAQWGTPEYLEDARIVGRWIVNLLKDTRADSFGGYFSGYPDGGRPKELIRGKSIENNADIFAAFSLLATAEELVGRHAAAQAWREHADHAGDFVMRMFEPTVGKFYAGTVPVGTATGPGIQPNGPQRGGEIINTFDFLDANTFAVLAMADADRYRNQIDWRRPIEYVRRRFVQQVSAQGRSYVGFSLTVPPIAGPAGVAWEFTGQSVVAMRYLDKLHGPSRSFANDADFFLEQIAAAQAFAPFGDRRGLVSSTIENVESLVPIEQCLSTPYQCIPARVGLAATVWAICAETGFNPIAPGLKPSLQVRKSGSVLSLSWPSHFTGLAVDEASSLTLPMVWKRVPSTPRIEGRETVVSVELAATERFFRLSTGK